MNQYKLEYSLTGCKGRFVQTIIADSLESAKAMISDMAHGSAFDFILIESRKLAAVQFVA